MTDAPETFAALLPSRMLCVASKVFDPWSHFSPHYNIFIMIKCFLSRDFSTSARHRGGGAYLRALSLRAVLRACASVISLVSFIMVSLLSTDIKVEKLNTSLPVPEESSVEQFICSQTVTYCGILCFKRCDLFYRNATYNDVKM